MKEDNNLNRNDFVLFLASDISTFTLWLQILLTFSKKDNFNYSIFSSWWALTLVVLIANLSLFWMNIISYFILFNIWLIDIIRGRKERKDNTAAQSLATLMQLIARDNPYL